MTAYDAFLARSDARNWDISMTAKKRLHEKILGLDIHESTCTSTLSNAFSLDIWLGDLVTTINELRLWVSDVHPFWQWPDLLLDTQHIRFTEAVAKSGRYGKEPFVRAVALDLNAHRGKAPRDVRNAHSAGFETMTAFAVHKNYPSQINYDAIPGVWLGAFEASIPGGDAWRDVPFLGWYRIRHEVGFSADGGGYASPDYAVPQSREL
jgi:hypothetical protein